eukprot:GHVN01046521.1.p1 GENE.GHVN01046521.1~~GHVN01046521.1.p1  ORF type:complete len:151 (+),score=5.91 GHVN01046521.1:67-453(+)
MTDKKKSPKEIYGLFSRPEALKIHRLIQSQKPHNREDITGLKRLKKGFAVLIKPLRRLKRGKGDTLNDACEEELEIVKRVNRKIEQETIQHSHVKFDDAEKVIPTQAFRKYVSTFQKTLKRTILKRKR